MTITKQDLINRVDHSLLKPNLTMEEYVEGLNYAKEIGAAAVCVNPHRLKLAKEILDGTGVEIGTVIGFPSGAHSTAVKVFEAKDAVENGATELDMVIDIGAMLDGDYDKVRADIKAVVDATPAVVKVILENAFLTKDQIKKGSKLVEEAGAHYVKTSTGFASSGSTVEDLQLMRDSVSTNIKVKAAGGLKTLEDCIAAIEAGADRVGISSTKAILAEFDQ